jgi:outer membrane lipoprotein-sorting protein
MTKLKCAFVMLVLLLPACAPKQIGPQAAKPWIPQQPLHSLAGFAEVDIKARGRAESFQAALIAELPNRLRIQILDDLGQERAVLVANGREVMWWDRREGTQKILPQDPQALKKTLRLPIGLEEFVNALLEGTKPQQKDTASSGYQVATEAVEDTPQGPYPRQWTWTFRKPKATLSFLFSQLKLNTSLDARKFDF